jgi:hypothetical protein
MFGMNKGFVLILFLAFILGYNQGWKTGLGLIIAYAIIRIIWKILT